MTESLLSAVGVAESGSRARNRPASRAHVASDLGAAALTGGLVLGGASILWQWQGIPVGDLTRDPSNSLHYPPYIGSVSSFGIMLWTVTASLCIFTGVVSRSALSVRFGTSAFFLSSGMLTALLMLDDLFLFHEKVFPVLMHIPEYVTLSSYVLLVGGYLVVFRREILRTDFSVLLVAGGLLAAAMVADTFPNRAADTSIQFLIEDGLKFLGIATWFTYYCRLCLEEMLRLVRPTSAAFSPETTSGLNRSAQRPPPQEISPGVPANKKRIRDMPGYSGI